jgi:hypothetical protein
MKSLAHQTPSRAIESVVHRWPIDADEHDVAPALDGERDAVGQWHVGQQRTPIDAVLDVLHRPSSSRLMANCRCATRHPSTEFLGFELCCTHETVLHLRPASDA